MPLPDAPTARLGPILGSVVLLLALVIGFGAQALLIRAPYLHAASGRAVTVLAMAAAAYGVYLATRAGRVRAVLWLGHVGVLVVFAAYEVLGPFGAGGHSPTGVLLGYGWAPEGRLDAAQLESMFDARLPGDAWDVRSFDARDSWFGEGLVVMRFESGPAQADAFVQQLWSWRRPHCVELDRDTPTVPVPWWDPSPEARFYSAPCSRADVQYLIRENRGDSTVYLVRHFR